MAQLLMNMFFKLNLLSLYVVYVYCKKWSWDQNNKILPLIHTSFCFPPNFLLQRKSFRNSHGSKGPCTMAL